MFLLHKNTRSYEHNISTLQTAQTGYMQHWWLPVFLKLIAASANSAQVIWVKIKKIHTYIYIYAMFQGTRSGLHELVKSIRFHWIISKLENNILVTGSFLSPLKHYVFQYNIIRLHNDTNSLIYYIRFSKLTMLTSV